MYFFYLSLGLEDLGPRLSPILVFSGMLSSGYVAGHKIELTVCFAVVASEST